MRVSSTASAIKLQVDAVGIGVTVLKTHAAPVRRLSAKPPMTTVVPASEIETAEPCALTSVASDPTSLPPSGAQLPPCRDHTHAPLPLVPLTAVLPSPERDTDTPC
jgi:hypothetical protein